MAQVDFSNAVLELTGGGNVVSYERYGLTSTGFRALSTNSTITSTKRETLVKETLTEYSVNYTGAFNAAGNGFRIFDNNVSLYRITGISFEAGDTFNFTIDTKLTVS